MTVNTFSFGYFVALILIMVAVIGVGRRIEDGFTALVDTGVQLVEAVDRNTEAVRTQIETCQASPIVDK